MTAPRAAIVFNASTGSDTAASGLGPATAISGTAAAHTGGSASTTITLTGSPDLSGVQAGDLLWLKTASGRQFSVIASADNSAKTVTVDDSFTIAEASAVNYAIGGKRATWDDADSRCLQADVKPGWTLETETDQSLTSAWTPTVAGVAPNVITIRGDSATDLRTITQTANARHFFLNNTPQYLFENLVLKNSNATKTTAQGIAFDNSAVTYARNCILGDPAGTNNLGSGIFRAGGSGSVSLYDCEAVNCTVYGVYVTNILVMDSCWVHGCANGVANPATGIITGNVIEGNLGFGLSIAGTTAFVRENTIHGNGSDNLRLTNAAMLVGEVTNNNLTGSTGGYGLNLHASQSLAFLIAYNNFGHASDSTANSSGNCNLTLDATNLNVAPGYTDAANHDFSVGTALKALGWPDATRYIGANQSATRSYVDIGAAQRQEAAGGGGGGNRIFGSGVITPLELAG